MPTDWSALSLNFRGLTTEFPSRLTQTFNLVKDNIDVVQSDLAESIEALHGNGVEGVGVVLTVGSGLSVRLMNCNFWLGGIRYVINEVPGYLVLSVPANQTSYLYLDSDFAVTAYVDEQTVSPEGTWYIGSCVTSADACVSVDYSGCECVAATSDLSGVVSDLSAAVGLPYSLDDNLQNLVALLLSGGDGETDPVSWGLLQKTYGVDPTTIIQYLAAKLSDHIDDYHTNTGSGSSEEITFLIQRWNVDAVRGGRTQLLLCRLLIPFLFHHLPDCAWVVWGVSGEGTDTYQFVDDVNSTWVPSGWTA